MTQPKTNWIEPSWETCLAVLDDISDWSGTNWLRWGTDEKPGSVIHTLAHFSGYSYSTVADAIKTLESYGMLEVERLSHNYPCQHNFVVWVRRRGEKHWTVEPYQAWSQTSVRLRPQVRTPRLALVASEGVRVA